MKRILIVAAHPDDEVLGCGGTIARHTLEGDEVYFLLLGEGVTSRYNQPGEANKGELKQLKLEAEKAAGILGVKRVFFRDFPDNRFDTIPLLDIVKAVEEVKEELRPEVIYTHHQGDLNIDHQLTCRAVLTACRPVAGETVKEIYAFESPSATEWSFSDAQKYFMPNVFVDISKTFDKKVAALKSYKSESREYPHPRSPEALRTTAMRWGNIVGCEAAEAFELIRAIR